MAITKVTRNLLSTGIDDQSNATAITIDSNENVGIGTTSPSGRVTIQSQGTSTYPLWIKHSDGSNGFLIYEHSSGELEVDLRKADGSSPKFKIDETGNVGIGTSSPTIALEVHKNASSSPILELKNTNAAGYSGLHLRNDSDILVGHLGYANASVVTALADEVFFGSISATPVVFTTSDAERIRIDSSGVVAIGAPTTYHNGSNGVYGKLGVQHTTSQGVSTAVFLNKSASLTNYTSTFTDGSFTSNTANYSFYTCYTGNGSTISDVEFSHRGDGQAYADGAWNGGGADYAEYFEWADGNSGSEDRRGWSVVLVNEKIRRATADDAPGTIIGVISGNPGVVGDSDIQGKWKGKYLTDDFGTPIRENVQAYSWETTDAEGNITTHSMHEDRVPEGVTVPTVEENSTFTSTTVDRKKDNPAYVEGQEYVQREYRPEWDTVGLMGKLRILKTEQKGTNWIKMRDISDSVEEWLVK